MRVGSITYIQVVILFSLPFDVGKHKSITNTLMQIIVYIDFHYSSRIIEAQLCKEWSTCVWSLHITRKTVGCSVTVNGNEMQQFIHLRMDKMGARQKETKRASIIVFLSISLLKCKKFLCLCLAEIFIFNSLQHHG